MKRWEIKGSHGCFFNVCLVVILVLFVSSFCWADDAMVLPKGRWMVNEVFNYYPSWDKQFNNQGDKEDLALDYNRIIDNQVINFLPPGTNVGRSIVDFEKKASITNFLISRALTDNLSIGLKIPFWTFKNKVKASLDNTTANMVKNPDPNTMALMPLIPIAMVDPNLAEQQKLTRDDIIDFLSDGLDINGDSIPDIPGYGYKRFETWSGNDIGDIELGLKYQYFKNEEWRLALQVGGRFPTGREDDPDNLVDYGFGSGNYSIMLGFQNDYLGFKDLLLNGTIRYTNQFPDKETLRIPSAVDQPITNPSQKERIDRNQGDILELELSGSYKLLKGFTINTTYAGFFKGRDSVEGVGGHYTSLEDETSRTGHTLLIGASYNNLERYQEKLARVPFQLSVSHWHRFAGKNLNKTQYISLKAALFF